MKREAIGIRPGDLLRCPDRATARWHKVLRVGRRRDGTRYLTIRRSRLWRSLGLPSRQVLEWSMLRALGYGIRRAHRKAETTAAVAESIEATPCR